METFRTQGNNIMNTGISVVSERATMNMESMTDTVSHKSERGNKFMTSTIRDYTFNGTTIMGIDHGYGNIKTARTIFPSSAVKSNSEPAYSNDYLEYDGFYYLLGEERKGFVAEKVSDEENYILTIAAIAKELRAKNMTYAKLHLAVGLPLTWVKSQKKEFEKYLLANEHLEVRYKGKRYEVDIMGCTVMPQCYSAVAESLGRFKGMNLIVDVGNGTMNVLYLFNGKVKEKRMWTEKLGIFQCAQKIFTAASDKLQKQLMPEVVEEFIRTGTTDLAEKYLVVMEEAARKYVEEIFQKLKDVEYDEDLMQLYDMGGGAGIIERYAEYDKNRVHFDKNLKANARGYEYFCYMKLRNAKYGRV